MTGTALTLSDQTALAPTGDDAKSVLAELDEEAALVEAEPEPDTWEYDHNICNDRYIFVGLYRGKVVRRHEIERWQLDTHEGYALQQRLLAMHGITLK